MRYRYEFVLRWSDLDLQGHVNNVVFADMLQEARVSLLALSGQQDHDLSRGLVVVRNDITYLAPISYRPAPVVVEVWVSNVGAATFTLGYELLDRVNGRCFARAATTLAPADLHTGQPLRVNQSERDLLLPYLDETPVTPAQAMHETPVVRFAEGYCPITVRFSDVDSYGHANNIRHFDYVQEGRIRLSDALGWRVGLSATAGLQLFVARAEVHYRRQLRSRAATYDLWTWVSHVGRTSFTLDTAIEDSDVDAVSTTGNAAETGPIELARARVVGVWVDPRTGRPTEPSEELRSALTDALGRDSGSVGGR